jgi:predicted bacteriocin transport accessory protein
MVDNGDAFIIIIERTGCSYCTMYMPIVKEVADEKKIPIYYIDTDTLSSDEMNLLSTTNNYLKKNQWGTPTTLFMLGSRVLDNIDGYVQKESVLSFLDGKVVMGE